MLDLCKIRVTDGAESYHNFGPAYLHISIDATNPDWIRIIERFADDKAPRTLAVFYKPVAVLRFPAN